MRLMILFFLFYSIEGFSQEYSIELVVQSKGKESLIGANVRLLHIPDSAETYSTTDADGAALFNRLKPGRYSVVVTYVGYRNEEAEILLKTENVRRVIVLEEEAVALEGVTVTARRPLITQEDDKMIIDPQPIANTSTNTLEILEKTPGLFVDQDGNIYLTSATPAVVYINGREQRMGAQDIAGILRSLPPDNIQRIEVLRTPSTKYDAASSGGIVNVVLKKGVKLGRSGAVSMGMNQGVYGNRFAGFNVNDSGEKTTYYLRANLSQSDVVEDLTSVRFVTTDSLLRQEARTRRPGDQGFVGLGMSLDPNERLNFSYDARFNASHSKSASQNLNLLETIENKRLSENDNTTQNNSRFFSIQQDLGMQLKLDTIDSEWENKVSYSYNSGSNAQEYSSAFRTPFSALIEGQGDNAQTRHFLLVQSDLTLQLPRRVKVETGLKSTYQHYDSQADYFLRAGGGLIGDPSRTNAFRYRETIHAAYAQASKTLPGNFTLKAGTRMEYTHMKGNQTIPSDTSFLIKRADFFPYVYLSRPVIEIAKFELRGFLIYRRTINRPGYQSLNPYIRYVDQYLYETGNPGLQPQFTDNFEANLSFDDMPILAVGRNYTTNIFSQVVYQDPAQENVLVRTQDNVGKNVETYFRITGAIPPGGKYFFVVGAQYNYNEYDGRYENQPLSFARGSWRFFTYHQLNLTKTTKLTANGFLLLKGQQNFYELDQFGQLSLGLNQSLLKSKLQITLNATDVLRTMATRFTLNQGGVFTIGDRYSDNQRFGVNLRYQFGLRKKEESRDPASFDVE
ncbi:MAG: TonB-dependent receptor [Haliscomenobacter sp.]|nr:TonB-dependent receptor [Haliscomenobacter sp.]